MTGYEAKVIADSVQGDGIRITTIQATFPRFILAEMNTHRVFSRNSASSRAVPVKRMIERATAEPLEWGKNQSGMQAKELLEPSAAAFACSTWNSARRNARFSAEDLAELQAHKQITNRVLEPFLWHTVVITSTQWENFFAQRCHPDAQPEMRKIAELIRDARNASVPQFLHTGEWHIPYVTAEDFEGFGLIRPSVSEYHPILQISAARCARTSYDNQGTRRPYEEEYALYERLVEGHHGSPLEHQAEARPKGVYTSLCANFVNGWLQFRGMVMSSPSDPRYDGPVR